MEEARASTLRGKPRLKVVKGERIERPKPLNLLTSIRTVTFQCSHAEMAKRMEISKHALIRLEQGTYNEILPKALNWYLNNTHYSELLLTDSYESFQTEVRGFHLKYFGDISRVLSDSDKSVHPFRSLRGLVNLAQVSKDLCLPYATLVYFERNYRQQKSVPKNLVNVLREIGYNSQAIDDLKEAYRTFRISKGCSSG